MSKRSKVEKQPEFKALKVTLIILFYIVLPLIIVSGLLLHKIRFLFLAVGAFLVAYSIVGLVLKIPLFNRHYIYNTYDFDNRFGLRHYIAFSIMIFLGLILFLISFGV